MGTHCLALGQMRSQECVKAMKWMVGLPVWLSGKCGGNRDGSGILPSSLQALAGGYGQDDVGGGILLPHPEGVGVSVVGAGGFIRVWVLVMGTSSSLSLGFASFGVFVVVGIPVVVGVRRRQRSHCRCKAWRVGPRSGREGYCTSCSGWVRWHMGGMPLATLRIGSWEWRHTKDTARISPRRCLWFFRLRPRFRRVWWRFRRGQLAGGVCLALRCRCRCRSYADAVPSWFIWVGAKCGDDLAGREYSPGHPFLF